MTDSLDLAAEPVRDAAPAPAPAGPSSSAAGLPSSAAGLPASAVGLPAAYRVMPFPDRFTAAVGPYYSRIEAGRPLIALPLRDIHVSIRGYCHGTVIAGLADLQSLAASYSAGIHDRLAATINLSVDFISGARLGSYLELRTDLLRVSRQFLFSQTLVVSGDGTLVARSSAVFKWDPLPTPDPEIVRRLFEP